MVESLTYCTVCFESFDREDRVALVMSCGHTFCKACILLIPEPVRCPYCRAQETRDIADLPKNFLVYQIQTQTLPHQEIPICEHACHQFYCKVCKYPICVDCVVLHSTHGLMHLRDPALETQIRAYLEQIYTQLSKKLEEVRLRKAKAAELVQRLETEYQGNSELIRAEFEKMRQQVQEQEAAYIQAIGQLYQSVLRENQEIDNISVAKDVKVTIDEGWIKSNFQHLGNVGVMCPSRQELSVKRSSNFKAVNWKYSGRIDALTFEVDRDVRLVGIGVSTPYKPQKLTTVDEMKILRGASTHSDVVYLHSFPVPVPANLGAGVQKISFETIVPIEREAKYTIYLKMSGSKTYKCVDALTQVVARDKTKFLFSNTVFVRGDESNRTDVQCGPIVELFYLSS